MRRLPPLLLLLGCTTTAPTPPASHEATPPPGRPAAAEAYAARFPGGQGPLDVRVLSTSQHGPVHVVELTYQGAAGKAPVRATLVRPAAEGKRGVGLL